MHLVITPIEWSYVRSVICANKTNVHLKAQNERRLWVGGIGFAPMQTYRKSECLPHSPFCYQPILIGCWLWKPPEDVYILFFFWIKGDGDKLDLLFFNPHTLKGDIKYGHNNYELVRLDLHQCRLIESQNVYHIPHFAISLS